VDFATGRSRVERRLAPLAAAVSLTVAMSGCGSGSGPSHVVSTPVTPTPAANPTQQETQPVSPPPTQQAPAPPPPRMPLGGRTVVVDPGHNGGNAGAPQIINQLVPDGRGGMKPCNTTGTSTDAGYTEAEFNWDTALRVRRRLSAQGARVVLTRDSNSGVGPCVNQRAAIGNAARADAVIAIHADGGPSEGRGFSVLYAPDHEPTTRIYAASLRLAQDVHQALLASGVLPPSTYLGEHGYSVREDLAGLNLSTRPAIFVELGNMRNAMDAGIEADPVMRERLAIALVRGLDQFLTSSR
jgi:N-acetylmuramoyl-L-alanine amidase